MWAESGASQRTVQLVLGVENDNLGVFVHGGDPCDVVRFQCPPHRRDTQVGHLPVDLVLGLIKADNSGTLGVLPVQNTPRSQDGLRKVELSLSDLQRVVLLYRFYCSERSE